MDEKQLKKYEEWLQEHDKKCEFKDSRGAIGGRFTFTYINTSLGLVEKIECACGADIDLTDYSKIKAYERKMSPENEQAYIEWLEVHKRTCKYARNQSIEDENITFGRTNTGLGLIFTAKCKCGEEKDFTDYMSW